MANNEYKTTYYIPRLEIDLDYAHQNYTSVDDEIVKEVARRLEVVRNEVNKELEHVGREALPSVDQLTPEGFNSVLFNEAKDFLKTSRKVYSNRYNDASNARDKMVTAMSQEEQVEFELMKNKFANERIKLLVRNAAVEERVMEDDGHLIRKIYPIYMDPQPSSPIDFREQFYFPTKHFLGTNYDTKVFNTIVIWVMTFVLIITLYFDIFRKVVEGFSMPGRR